MPTLPDLALEHRTPRDPEEGIKGQVLYANLLLVLLTLSLAAASGWQSKPTIRRIRRPPIRHILAHTGQRKGHKQEFRRVLAK